MICKSIIKYITIPYHFCILTNTVENIHQIQSLLSEFCSESTYTVKALHKEDTDLLSSLYVPEGRRDITAFGYSQLLLPDYFSQFKKILFLEPDQIVRGDLAPMWKDMFNRDIKLAAVPYEAGPFTWTSLISLYPTRNCILYNAGVTVVDTEFWKAQNCKELCLDACRKQKEMNGNYYNFYAEGAMNIALQIHFTQLDRIYNMCNLGYDTHIPTHSLDVSIILHWNGHQKPWRSDGLYKEYYTA